jgi:hypothetical protein
VLTWDVHNALSIEVEGNNNHTNNGDINNQSFHDCVDSNENRIVANKWNDENANVFCESVIQKLPLINDITNMLLLLDRNTVDCNYINDESYKICNIFAMFASEAFGKKVAGETCNNKISF